MGSFQGHALPGSFFIVFGIYWTIQVNRRIQQTRRTAALGGQRFRTTATFPCGCSCGRLGPWQWEGFVKVFFTMVGFLAEVITARENGQFNHIANGQHATMFFFFGLSGLTDILLFHRVAGIPRGADYVIGIMAVLVEAVLFAFHTHGRNDLDVLVHSLLVYLLLALVIVLCCEMRFPHAPIFPLLRAFLVLVQGSWFWQIGFLLYNPLPSAQPWDKESHVTTMVAAMMFGWHLALCYVFMLCVGVLVALLYSRGWCGASDSIRVADVEKAPRYRLIGKDTLRSDTEQRSGATQYSDNEDDLFD